MDPYMNDPAASQFYHVPTNAHSGTNQRRSGSPSRDQRSYMPYSGQFSGRGAQYPFYAGMPTAYPPAQQPKGADPRVGTQYQSPSSSRPPDLLIGSRSVEVTRAGPAQALSTIVPSPTSQIITSHRVIDHTEALEAAGPSRRFSGQVRMGAKPPRGSPRATPSLIKAEAPTTLDASMSGSDCFSTAEEPVPYALTSHPIFSEDLQKACTPIRKVENPFAVQRKSANSQSVYGEYEIQRYRNDVSSGGHYHQQQHSSSKMAAAGMESYPNGVKEHLGAAPRNEYAIPGGSSNAHDPQGTVGGGALDLSLKSFRNTCESAGAIYLGKEPREPAKQTMPYDYSRPQPSAKRSADNGDPNAARSKYLKANSTPNHAAYARLPQSSTTKGALDQSDSSSFAQAHTSLTMPYGRQIQSANSSGYFSEGISESGVASPVSPRVKPPYKVQEKERMEQKYLEVDPYFQHGRPSSKNSPYSAYSAQYSNVYDRGRLDESAIKFNSQSSYGNSVDAYYAGLSMDRYRTIESVPDNSMPFRSSTSNYGKTVDSSMATRHSYDNYMKSVNIEPQYTDQKPPYPQLFKTEISPPRAEVRRQPKIEIAAQPINLVEDNEISIEKAHNNTLPFEAFGPRGELKVESNSFQAELLAKELKANRLAARADAIRSRSVTPTKKVIFGENMIEQRAASKLERSRMPESAIKPTATLNTDLFSNIKPITVCGVKESSSVDTAINFANARKGVDSKDKISSRQNYNHVQNISESATVKHNIEGTKTNANNGISVNCRAVSDVGGDKYSNSQTTIRDTGQIMADNIVSKSGPINVTETTKENVLSLAPKENDEIATKIKQEKGDVKCDTEINRAKNEFINVKSSEVARSNKVNYADVNSLKEQSVHRNLPHILTRNHHSGGNIALPKPKSFPSAKIAPPPVLNLSVPPTEVASTARKFLDEIPPRPNSQTRGHSTPLDRTYQHIPFNNYYDPKTQPVGSLPHNNMYTQRSHSSQPASHYSQMSATDKTKYPYSSFHPDATVYDTKQAAINEHKNLHLLQGPSKPESCGVVPKQSSATDNYLRAHTNSSHGTNLDATVDTTPKAYQHKTAKDTYLSHLTSESNPLNVVPSKQIPLAINPRVLSPWNSSVPHSLPPASRKPAPTNSHQMPSPLRRDATTHNKEASTDSDKKPRMSAAYPHTAYGSQYQYMQQPEASHGGSLYPPNAVSERPQSTSFDSKSSAYVSPRAYPIDSRVYKSYPTAAAPVGNDPSVSQPYNNSGGAVTSRPLLTPHSPPHPPPTRLDYPHASQPLYSQQSYNATSQSSRPISDHYTRTSPHFPVVAAGDPKYPSRDYPPTYPYKNTYGQPSGTADRAPSYPTTSQQYYPHLPYNSAGSATATATWTNPQTSVKYEYPPHQSYPPVTVQEVAGYAPERSAYGHAASVYGYPAGSSDKTLLPPPAAHVPHTTSTEYKPTAYYDNLHAMPSPQTNLPYSNQLYLEQKAYAQAHAASKVAVNHINPAAIPSPSGSYPHSTVSKSPYQGYPNSADNGSGMQPEYETGQYSHPYPRSVERSSTGALIKSSYKAANRAESLPKSVTPKAQPSVSMGELEVKLEYCNDSAACKPNSVPSQVAAKDNNGKLISNPVQPLYSSWPNYKAPHPDSLNKQVVRTRAIETLQNTSQKYPSFKTDRDRANVQGKINSSSATPFLGKILQPSNATVKSSPAKEQVPFTRPENNSKPLLQNRFNSQTEQILSDLSKENKPNFPLPDGGPLDMDFDQMMSIFEADLKTNAETVVSKKSQDLAQRYAHKVDLQRSAETAGTLEDDVHSFEESDGVLQPPDKFRGKINRIKVKKQERVIISYASQSDDSSTEMIADEDESDFEEELVKEIRAKARKGRAKDKLAKDTPDDSDASSGDRHTRRKSKLKKESGIRDTSSNNSSDISSDSSEESNSSDSSANVARAKRKPSVASSSECETRLTRNTRSKKSSVPIRDKAKKGTTRKRRRSFKHLSDLSEDEVKAKRVRSIAKDYSSNSEDDDTLGSSTDCDNIKIGAEKGRRLVLESYSDDDSEKTSISSESKDPRKPTDPDTDPILRKLETQRKLELSRSDVIEMKAWQEKTGEQAAVLLKALPALPMRHSWRRPLFSGVFKKGWQAEMRKYKQEAGRTPKQLVSIPSMPANMDRRRGRGVAKGAGTRGKDSKDGLYSKAMVRRFFDKVLQINGKDDESLSRASSSPYSTFTPTGLTPTPSVSPSMLVTGVGGSHDSDKDSLIISRGASPPASDSATLRRRSIATTIIQKIQRQQCKNRRHEAPWLNSKLSRGAVKIRTPILLSLPRSPSSDSTSRTRLKNKAGLDVARIRSVFGVDDSLASTLTNSSSSSTQRRLLNKVAKRKTYFAAVSSSTHSTSSTPSTPVGNDEVGGIVVSRKRKMKKFRSGFDYIPRKKKKLKPFDELTSKARKKVAARRRRVWPENTRDVATEVKTWVINKGLGETALHRAARLQYHDVVIYCLESKEINVNARDNAGYTPLHEACNRGHLDVAQALCAFGARVNAPGYGGMRPLHEASDNGHAQLIRLLLSYGADINLASYGGQSCLTLATDSVCGRLVVDFTTDLRGKKTPPWPLEGPARLFDLKEQGADCFSEAAPKTDVNSNSFVFETCDALMPNTYSVQGHADDFVLLDELLERLDCTYGDFITKIECVETVHLSRREFDQRVGCLVYKGNKGKNKSPAIRNGEVVLVKYTIRLQKLLGVESVTIT